MDDRDSVTEYLLKRFKARLRGDTLAYDAPLISNGVIDSFGLLEVLSFLEDTFDVTIDPSEHEPSDFETVDEMMAVVRQARGR
jgi:acyl carrier protein